MLLFSPNNPQRLPQIKKNQIKSFFSMHVYITTYNLPIGNNKIMKQTLYTI